MSNPPADIHGDLSPDSPPDPLSYYAVLLDRLNGFVEVISPSHANVDALNRMARYGLASAEQIAAFLDAVQKVSTELSIELSAYSLPDEFDADPATPDPLILLVAHMVFSADERAAIAAAGHDLVTWLDAVMLIGRDGRARGDGTRLALQNHEHDEESVVLRALQIGMTPGALVERAAELAERGVANADLVRAVGADAAPADLLVADPRAARHLAEIRTGANFHDDAPARIGHGDAVAVLRALVVQEGPLGTLDTAVRDASRLVSAGAGSAAEVLELYPLVRDGKLTRELVTRAAGEGLTPAQWVPLLTRIGKRSAAYGQRGLLPLRILAEAADGGVSVKAWDENVRAARRGNYSGSPELTSQAPWADVYPVQGFDGHVVQLAAAGISPTLLDACHRFYTSQVNAHSWDRAEAMVDDILGLHRAGLTLPLLIELSNIREGVRLSLTVDQTMQALRLGVTVAAVRDIRERLAGREFGPVLLEELAAWERSRDMVSAWLAAQQVDPPRWAALTGLTAVIEGWKGRRRRTGHLELAVEAGALIAAADGQIPALHIGHLNTLIELVSWLIDSKGYTVAETKYQQTLDRQAAQVLIDQWRQATAGAPAGSP